MKKVKKIVFKIQNRQVDVIDADDITLQEIENLKVSMAFAHGVGSQDIEAVAEDVLVRELSEHLMINPLGLMFKEKNIYSIFVPVKSLAPSFNIKTEDGFQKFLDLIFREDIDGAVKFQ